MLIYNGDYETLLGGNIGRVACIIADPPDNLGLNYGAYSDSKSDTEYQAFLTRLMMNGVARSNHFWLSYYHRYDLKVSIQAYLRVKDQGYDWHKYLWRYTFGQHRESDCGSGYRPILRLSRPGYPISTTDIRVPSDRQTIYNDPRANPNGRIPDDVWEFPRVTGNALERRAWHPTQHPEGVYCRIIRMSTKPGDTVIDAFGGTGTLFRAGRYVPGRKLLMAEIDANYCLHIAAEHSCKVTTSLDEVKGYLDG